MKKLIIFVVIIVLAVLFYNGVDLIKYDEKPRFENSIGKLNETIEVLGSKNDPCKTMHKEIDFEKLEQTSELLWNNIHIRHTDGEVYRIRYFYDDGPNGQFKKTILYKEGVDKFPHILRTFSGFERKELKEYFEEGEIIWKEEAFSSSDDSIFWRKINNKVKEFTSENTKCAL